MATKATKATKRLRARLGLILAGAALLPGAAVPLSAAAPPSNAWMAPRMVAEQSSAKGDAAKEAVGRRRARMLLAAMTLPQKLQQLTGSKPELLPELPRCFGARHVTGIPALNIPTFRITNGPVGLGQNDCVSRKVYDDVVAKAPGASLSKAYTHPSSAQATALPSAIAVAASFDPGVAADFGGVIATEMHNLALHVFEAPGINMARLPILGRNFEYFGEDPFLAGTMAVAEIRAVQSRGLIAMPKHFIANEQETRRQTIQTSIDRQTLRELYLLPFEMAVRDGDASAIMCAYNYVNGVSSCENREMLTDVLRRDWGFTGYVQTDFFAMKSTVATMKAGLDHEMPLPQFWSPDKINAALTTGELTIADIDGALERRFTQMFKRGIFDRPIVQSPIDFVADGAIARRIGGKSAVLLQNNGALPLGPDARSVVLVGKASQVYAQQAVAGGSMLGQPMGGGGGSSDVVPHATVTPIDGLRAALAADGHVGAQVRQILVDDTNETATVDGRKITFAEALGEIAGADAVVIMAGTIAEEGADRATFTDASGDRLAAAASEGSSLDWYTDKVSATATAGAGSNPARNSNTTAMIRAIMAAKSASKRTMAQKTALVLKDNAGVAMDPALVGSRGPAILEAWFPGQEDGAIVGDLLVGRTTPSGRLPVTFPFAGKGFLDSVTPLQFPGERDEQGHQRVRYAERLDMGYRWYDANASGRCAETQGRNPCVAFPFGFGLGYTEYRLSAPRLSVGPGKRSFEASVEVANVGTRAGSHVVQVYVGLPPSADRVGAKQPPRRLVGFRKIDLAPRGARRVAVAIDAKANNHPLSVWDEAKKSWINPQGRYTIWIGSSSAPRDLVTAGSFDLP